MQIQLNTDNHLQGDDRVKEVVERLVTQALGPVASRLSRVEVHIKDLNADKGGVDIRATLEARPEGLRPFGANHDDTDIESAVRGAAKKMRARLDHEFGKLADKR
ncbi:MULTISPECIES: HPF/RaiA family ribosome-associated protein [unclassified Rhodosalinus]|uniref:HPF/RaiA family ribosome-associated protein n=1 Tax=unclassified Rhodosalinus TaxID=2630183 RepID=UPI003524B481